MNADVCSQLLFGDVIIFIVVAVHNELVKVEAPTGARELLKV
jgi:hypothetical protein